MIAFNDLEKNHLYKVTLRGCIKEGPEGVQLVTLREKEHIWYIGYLYDIYSNVMGFKSIVPLNLVVSNFFYGTSYVELHRTNAVKKWDYKTIEPVTLKDLPLYFSYRKTYLFDQLMRGEINVTG